MTRTVLVAGAAGFIGAALSQGMQHQAERVVGFDNLNYYYNPSFKKARLLQIEAVDPSGALLFVRLVMEHAISSWRSSQRRSRLWWSTSPLRL